MATLPLRSAPVHSVNAPDLARRGAAGPAAADGRQFKVLLSSHTPLQLSLFSCAAPPAPARLSRTA